MDIRDFFDSSHHLRQFYEVFIEVKIYAIFQASLYHGIREKWNANLSVTNLVVLDKLDIRDIPIVFFSDSSHFLQQFYEIFGKVEIYAILCESSRIL